MTVYRTRPGLAIGVIALLFLRIVKEGAIVRFLVGIHPVIAFLLKLRERSWPLYASLFPCFVHEMHRELLTGVQNRRLTSESTGSCTVATALLVVAPSNVIFEESLFADKTCALLLAASLLLVFLLDSVEAVWLSHKE
jgi:hypothetical protein